MSVDNNHSDFYGLVSRYLSGELGPDELQDFEALLQSDPEKKALADEFRKIWNAVGSHEAVENYDLDAEWRLMQNEIPDLGRGRSLLFYSYRIAAVLVLGLIIASGWIYGTRIMGTERIVAREEPVEVILEDGSQITINRDSWIRYKKKFASTGRKVFLNGEAWFDVARDTARPFVIDAGPALVEVLGTSFNVNAYKGNSTVEITVESGMVALTAKQEKQTMQEQIVLQAGNSGSYHKQDQELVLIPAADPNNIAWKTRDLYFDGATLQEVVDLVNVVYDARLIIANEELALCPITVTFSHQSLDAILNVLKVTLDLEVIRTDKEIRLDGVACTQ